MKDTLEKINSITNNLNERLKHIYLHTEDKLIEPGIYEVIETDGGGMRDIIIDTIEIKSHINLKDLMIKYFERTGYITPWNNFTVRKPFKLTNNYPTF